MLVSNYIRGAMEELMLLTPSENPTAADSSLGLRMLNEMLDSWAGVRSTIFETKRSLYQLVPNQPSYTIGESGADWTGFRPGDILRAGFVDTVNNPTEPLETPIEMMTDQEWADVSLKSLTDSISWRAWYQMSIPNGTFWIYPISSVAAKVALYVPTPLGQITEDDAGLATDLIVPPAGRRAIRLNLAMMMAPSYEKEVSPLLQMNANTALNNYIISFAARMKLAVPNALRRRRGYNILTNQGGY